MNKSVIEVEIMRKILVTILAGLTSTAAIAQVESIIKIAGRGTPLPDGTAVDHPARISIHDGRIVAYVATTDGPGNGGYYESSDGALSELISLGDPLPDDAGAFGLQGHFSVDSSTLTFENSTEGTPGLYSLGESSQQLFSVYTSIPGVVEEPRSIFSVSSTRDGRFAFGASGPTSHAGVFLFSNGQFQRIADDESEVPGYFGVRFWSFRDVWFDGGAVAFLANYRRPGDWTQTQRLFVQSDQELQLVPSTGFCTDADIAGNVVRVACSPTEPEFSSTTPKGLYEFADGTLVPLLTTGAASVAGVTRSWNIQYLSTSGADTAFFGTWEISNYYAWGIYVYRGGTITKVVGMRDQLDGYSVNGIHELHQDSIDDGRIAFMVQFEAPSVPSGYTHTTFVAQLHSIPPCVDITNDRRVGLDDLAALLANFGAVSDRSLRGDLNGDSTVNLTDLAALLAAFGENCSSL